VKNLSTFGAGSTKFSLEDFFMSHAKTSPEAYCKRVDSTATAHDLGNGWYVAGEPGQPLAFNAGHNDGPEVPFQTEAEAWEAAERFLLESQPVRN
jgi:hypothetical protein